MNNQCVFCIAAALPAFARLTLQLANLALDFWPTQQQCSLCRHGFAARFLIEQGADPFIQDRIHHRSAIHYAAAKGKADALRRLLDDNLQIHTDEGFLALKAARVQDVSGNCRWLMQAQPFLKATSLWQTVRSAFAHIAVMVAQLQYVHHMLKHAFCWHGDHGGYWVICFLLRVIRHAIK